jgi:hypothetical protein
LLSLPCNCTSCRHSHFSYPTTARDIFPECERNGLLLIRRCLICHFANKPERMPHLRIIFIATPTFVRN